MIRAITIAAVVAIASPARAGELTSSGPLAIRAPDGLVLGRDATAELHLRAEPGVKLVTNVGTISQPVADGDQLRATLTLPDQRFPQLAIVAATAADGSVRDWLAIPLAGQARVKVDTERLAAVVVRVGSVEFGPVKADPRGVAQIDIVVPPGITQATTIATGTRGAIRDKPLPLGVAPFSRILALCDGVGDRVSVIATLATGAPAPTAPRVTASEGVLGAVSASAPGVFVATHDGNAAGDTADIVATFPGDNVAATCRLRVPPEVPHAIRIVPERARFVAGSGAVRLMIALDYHGTRRPLEITTITLETDSGTIDAPQRATTGWTAGWTLPNSFAGKRIAHATVRATIPHGELHSQIEIPLIATAPARIEVTGPARLRGNGRTDGTISARVLDRFDNAVTAPALRSRGRGQLAVFTPAADGWVTAGYITPHVRDSGEDVVEITDPTSGLTGHARIRLDGVGRQFVGSMRLGYLSNLGRVSTPIAAVAADLRLPVLDDRLIAGIEVVGYSASFDAPSMDVTESVSGRVRALPALLRLAYRRSVGAADLWVGAGAGAAFASSRLSSPSSGMQEAATARFAATGYVGGATRTGPGWIVVEAAYLHATLADGPIAGRIGGLIATAGFALEL